MTRVLCITSNYPPHHVGGYEVSCADVMVRLAERGHEVTVLTSDERRPGVDDPAGEAHTNPCLRRELRRYFRDDDLWAPGPAGRWRIERHNVGATRRALAEARPDVIAVWHIGAISLNVLRAVIGSGLPIVYAISDDWLSYCTTLDRWLTLVARLGSVAPRLAPLLRVGTTPPDLGPSGAFCFISECTRDRAVALSPWSLATSSIVYSGVDRRMFTARAGAPPWRWRLIYVGRLDARKGIETAIRAMALLPAEAVLEIQGTGDATEEARLRSIGDDLGISDRLRFERVPRTALPERYRQADVCIFPSEWEEPFGLVPLEAMACGVPTVATGVGGSGEFLLDDGNCLRFDAGDPASLAAVLRRLAGDAALRDRLVPAGIATAEYFDVDHLTDCFEAWHASAAEGHRHGVPASRRFSLGGSVA